MLVIDENFIINEDENIFTYFDGKEKINLPTKNLESCAVYVDMEEFKGTKKEYNSFTYGKIPFFEDISELTKAVSVLNDVVIIYFKDKNGETTSYRKKFDSKDEKQYEIVKRVNKLIG